MASTFLILFVFSDCKEKEPTAEAQDSDAARRLWDLSVEITEGKQK